MKNKEIRIIRSQLYIILLKWFIYLCINAVSYFFPNFYFRTIYPTSFYPLVGETPLFILFSVYSLSHCFYKLYYSFCSFSTIFFFSFIFFTLCFKHYFSSFRF